MMPKARTRNGRGRSGALRRGVERTVACDRLAIGYGLVPNIETELLFGCATAQEAIQVNRWQQTSLADIYAAGEYTGFGGSERALAEGEIAGYAAAGASEQAQALFARQRPLAVWLAAAAAERAAVSRPCGNAYCPRQAERRAVTATLLHHRARQGRQAQ